MTPAAPAFEIGRPAGQAAGAGPDVAAATAVARAFYEYHFAHDMGFGEAALLLHWCLRHGVLARRPAGR